MPSKRRGNNEGSVYQRGDGKWVAQLHLGWVGGKRKRRSFYGNTRREAAEKLRKAQQQDQRAAVADHRKTVGAYLADWVETWIKPNCRPKTYRSYRQTIDQHLIPELGHIKLQKLGPKDIQDYISRKRETALSPRTVQYHIEILRNALNRAVKWQILAQNPVAYIDIPRADRLQFRYLDPAEARRLLAAVRGDRLEALYTVATALGLRQGEILGLRWEDVDFDHNRSKLTVRRQLQRDRGGLQSMPLKTDRAQRTIPLPNVVTEALRTHRIKQLEEQLAGGDRWHNELNLVFTTTAGTPIDARNLNRQFERHLNAAGLPRIRFHDLRHSAASLMLALGIEPRTIMATLGHSQISLTMNTYAHVVPTLQQDAADKMDKLFSADR